MKSILRSACMTLLVAASMLRVALPAAAAPFEVAVSPSRFELQGKGGERIGQSLAIQNMSNTATQISVRTIDWTYTGDGEIGFHDELTAGSCRPWVTLERGALDIPAHGKKTFRFQLDVPLLAARGECRFMIGIEGTQPAQQSVIRSGGASLSLPVSGRIAVAVYLQIGGAQPKLELRQMATRNLLGKKSSYLTIVNSGDAHGRLQGSLDATDSKGRSFELVPEGTPILPAQTRTLALVPRAEAGDAAVQYVYPFKVSGMLDWDRGSFKVDAELK